MAAVQAVPARICFPVEEAAKGIRAAAAGAKLAW
jgi:hypothetical protein